VVGLIGVNILLQDDGLNEDQNNEESNDQINRILPSRESKIPVNKTKMSPERDNNPPKSCSEEYLDPIPVPGKVNTAGGEDSAFIMPDGETLYFFFTPDVAQPVENQVQDQVTGIYVSSNQGGIWGDPTRVILQDHGKLALDGCAFIHGDIIYFCSAREGYSGLHWFRAELINGTWCNWDIADYELKTDQYSTGELHISGNELYFHSDRPGGKGLLDIWVSVKADGEWGEPTNIALVNSEGNEGWPCISEDASELWFSKDYGVWRSKKVNGEWGEPEKMFWPLAGEPSIDRIGNVYFTHHFFQDDVMIEADIYVAYRKTQ
jgi:hypothetical protein